MKANNDIREMAKEHGVCLWQIGERLGMNDYSFSRKLRHELSPEEKEKVKIIISEMAQK